MQARFSTSISPREGNYKQALELLRLAEDAGFVRISVPDTPALHQDMFAVLSIYALNSSRVYLGPKVTNPLSRNPVVMASGMATLDELSNGRAFMGIATGDSGVFNLGLRPAKLQELRDYIVTLRELYLNKVTEYRGRKVHFTWAKRAVPAYVAAEGPKTLQMAGEFADGVIVGSGLTPEVVKGSLAQLEAGAKRAGRTLQDLDIWWQVKFHIGNSRAQAIEDIRMGLAASANHAFRFTLEGKQVPEEFVEQIRGIQQGYKFEEHEQTGHDRNNARLVEDLRLREYLARRFSVAGSAEECIEQFQALVEAGANQFYLSIVGPDNPRTIRETAEKIIPRFR